MINNELTTNGNNNGAKYNRFVGAADSTAWCAAFVSYVISNTNYNKQKIKNKLFFNQKQTKLNIFFVFDTLYIRILSRVQAPMVRKELSQNIFSKFRLKTQKALDLQGLLC